MQGQAVSGQSLPFPGRTNRRTDRPTRLRLNHSTGSQARGVWQRWRSLHDDILRHVHACDRLGIVVTIDLLAEELDEALGLVERRTEELQSLQLISCGRDRRIELDSGSRLRCG